MLVAKQRNESGQVAQILMLSAWSFAIVISSFLFLYIGYRLDRLFGTAPSFMIGLLILAVFLAVGRLFQEAWLKQNP